MFEVWYCLGKENRAAGEVCEGFTEDLPEMISRLLEAGAFDDGIEAGAAGLRAVASRRGRRVPPYDPPD